jgi:hypothetical protein
MNVYNFFLLISDQKSFLLSSVCAFFSGVLRTRMEPVAKMWTKNAANATPIFHATTARYQFYQILCVIHFNDKTTRNQQTN